MTNSFGVPQDPVTLQKATTRATALSLFSFSSLVAQLKIESISGHTGLGWWAQGVGFMFTITLAGEQTRKGGWVCNTHRFFNRGALCAKGRMSGRMSQNFFET